MPEYKKPKSKNDFNKNFAPKKPLMNNTEAFYESSRCLFCYDAPCMKACPTSIDIPLFIKQIQTKNTKGAAKTIYDANWMGNACGTVCPTRVLCEGSCVYDNQNVPVIQIGRLQNFATKAAIEQNIQLYKPGTENGKKIAIIGAGPAGISCACELRTLGYSVDIYEAKSKPSGLTVYGIAPYKISNEEVLDEVAYLKNQLGFNIIYNSPINDKNDISKLELDYEAIFIGVGLGPTAILQLPGEDKQGVIGAVEFIEDLRMNHHKTKVKNRVIIIGGGNTAMDAASESARMGAEEVTLVYRRSKDEKGAYGFEYDLAVQAGVNGLFNANPIEIIGNGKVEGVKFIRTETVEGRFQNVEGSEFIIDCEMVIKATGQAKMADFLSKIDGLELDDRKRLIINEKSFQTTNPKYFAGGDVVNGGAEVVNGAFDGKNAAKGINSYLSS